MTFKISIRTNSGNDVELECVRVDKKIAVKCIWDKSPSEGDIEFVKQWLNTKTEVEVKEMKYLAIPENLINRHHFN